MIIVLHSASEYKNVAKLKWKHHLATWPLYASIHSYNFKNPVLMVEASRKFAFTTVLAEYDK